MRDPGNEVGTNILSGRDANKDAKIYVGRSRTMHNRLFYTHTLFMNYLANTFLLVSSSVRSKRLLCFVQGQGQKRERKHTSKNFDEFHNHSPLLNVLRCASREDGIDQFQYIKIQHAATMYLFHRASTEVYLAQKETSVNLNIFLTNLHRRNLTYNRVFVLSPVSAIFGILTSGSWTGFTVPSSWFSSNLVRLDNRDKLKRNLPRPVRRIFLLHKNVQKIFQIVDMLN